MVYRGLKYYGYVCLYVDDIIWGRISEVDMCVQECVCVCVAGGLICEIIWGVYWEVK